MTLKSSSEQHAAKYDTSPAFYAQRVPIEYFTNELGRADVTSADKAETEFAKLDRDVQLELSGG